MTLRGKQTDDLVFVYGALRSGTTVFRLMLDEHPRISNPGEMDFLFDYLHEDTGAPGGWRYDLEALKLDRIFRASNLEIDPDLDGLQQLSDFIDQLRTQTASDVLSINIHRNVDRLVSVLPDIRLIHMLRDPRDVARSSIAMGWAGTLYHGVEHWISTENAWNRIATKVESSRVLTLTYEALFNETEASLHDVCAFLGVPYDSVMLNYHEKTTYSAPDAKLVCQWRTKCDPDEIALLEYRARTVMEAREYELSGPRMPSPVDLFRLQLVNKASIWSFGTRRFGATTYFGEKITRKLGWRSRHRLIMERMKDVTTRNLK